MREWPSIVPGAPERYCIVVNHYGRFGAAFAETDLVAPPGDVRPVAIRHPRRRRP